MTRLTDEKKLEVIIEHLTDVVDGGYPGDYLWIGDTLAYTGARGGSMGLKHSGELGTITRETMLAWYDRAAAFLEDNPDFDEDAISSALSETRTELPEMKKPVFPFSVVLSPNDGDEECVIILDADGSFKGSAESLSAALINMVVGEGPGTMEKVVLWLLLREMRRGDEA